MTSGLETEWVYSQRKMQAYEATIHIQPGCTIQQTTNRLLDPQFNSEGNTKWMFDTALLQNTGQERVFMQQQSS